jgi:hypothetical protein
VADQTFAERRAKLREVQALVLELVSLNEKAARVAQQMDDYGFADSNIIDTAEEMFKVAGPATLAGVEPNVPDGLTLTDRITTILNSRATYGIDWGVSYP